MLWFCFTSDERTNLYLDETLGEFKSVVTELKLDVVGYLLFTMLFVISISTIKKRFSHTRSYSYDESD